MTNKKKQSRPPDQPNRLYGRDAYIARLRAGETVQFGERGNSMLPIIKSGQKCTYAPIEGPEALAKGDIVFCKVGPFYYTHLIKKIRLEDGEHVFTIGNNHGRINGDTDFSHIYGKVVAIG
jgi:hypothetical protein